MFRNKTPILMWPKALPFFSQAVDKAVDKLWITPQKLWITLWKSPPSQPLVDNRVSYPQVIHRKS